MSEVEETQDWPTHCPECGTELQRGTVDMNEANADRPELRPGEMAMVDFCPNPDCPAFKPGQSTAQG
jgi:hypothetical protein